MVWLVLMVVAGTETTRFLAGEGMCTKELHHQPEQVISRALTTTMPQGDLLLQTFTIYREVRALHLPCRLVPISSMCHNETHKGLCGSLNFLFMSVKQTCEYKLEVPPQYYVGLTFAHFDLEMMIPNTQPGDCTYNNLLRIQTVQKVVLVELCGS